MKNSDQHARLELVLGGICEAPALKQEKHCIDIQVSCETLTRLVKHWAELPPPSRPRLRGLSLAKADGDVPLLNVVLDAGGRSPFLLILAKGEKGRPFPRLSGIWPYGAWWEEELRRFNGALIDGPVPETEARWLPH